MSLAKRRLFVRNVPMGLTEEDLTNIIKGKELGVVNIEMFKVCFVIQCLFSLTQHKFQIP